MNLREHGLGLWAGARLRCHYENRLLIGAAQRELSRKEGSWSFSLGYRLVTPQDMTSRFGSTLLPVVAHFWYKVRYYHGWLGEISARKTSPTNCIVRLLDDPRPVKLTRAPSRNTAAVIDELNRWWLQTRRGRALWRWLVNHVGESGAVELADPVATI